MARRTSVIRRPSRRERRAWALGLPLLAPVAVWVLAGHFTHLPAGWAGFLAGLTAGMAVMSPLARGARRAGRKAIRWLDPGDPLAIPQMRKSGAAK